MSARCSYAASGPPLEAYPTPTVRVGPCSTRCWSKRPLTLEQSWSTASWSMDWCGPTGACVGVEGHPRGSAKTTLRARVVVGADGLHSTIARATGARGYQEHPALTGVLYSYWSGLSSLGASFHARPDRLILVWPTNDDLTCIYVAWPHQGFPQVRKDVEHEFHAALGLVPGLADAVASGQREQRFVGTDDLPNLYRTSAGPGWALAGDAGHHKDPSTGMGMSDAFQVSRAAGRSHRRGAGRAATHRRCSVCLPEQARRPHRERTRRSP